MPRNLWQNLDWAEAAVKAAGALRGKASNRPEDIAHALLAQWKEKAARYDAEFGAGSGAELMEMMLEPGSMSAERERSELHMQRVADINAAREERRLAGERLNATAVRRAGIGNCFEHCILAADFLNGRGVSSYIVETDDDANHVFLVLGLADGLHGTTPELPVNTAPAWPPEAVVCDPWYHEWFGVADWPRKMRQILRTTWKGDGLPPDRIRVTLTAGSHVTR